MIEVAEIDEKFELSTRFCLFNKVILLFSTFDIQTSTGLIVFGMQNPDFVDLKSKLEKTAFSYFRKIGINDGKVEFRKVSEDEIKKKAIIKYGFSDETQIKEKSEKIENQDESVIVMFLDSILKFALEKGATDIHIEEKRIRFRVNGKLSDYCSLSGKRSCELIRRIKAISKLDSLESRKAQDGQFVFTKEKKRVSVRVSIVPVISSESEFCESAVLRLLDSSRVPLNFEKLGFSKECQEKFFRLSEKENGLLLICGATGSGKSTTAATFLRLILEKSKSTKKIITIEDPPEYVLDGMTQLKLDLKNGMDFVEALRFVFRQDPDVVFIGEVRDEISAKACLRSALTGHFVVATMHTSGFDETITRLSDLGVNKSDIKSSLRGIVMQKLFVSEDSSQIQLKAEIKEYE